MGHGSTLLKGEAMVSLGVLLVGDEALVSLLLPEWQRQATRPRVAPVTSRRSGYSARDKPRI
jgi:hypothetical protein